MTSRYKLDNCWTLKCHASTIWHLPALFPFRRLRWVPQGCACVQVVAACTAVTALCNAPLWPLCIDVAVLTALNSGMLALT